MKKANLLGQQFGRLTVVQDAPRMNGRTYWLCRCTCGVEKAIYATSLTTGRQVSCGCYGREVTARGTRTTHGLRHTPEYGIWAAMRRRCSDPKNKRFADYGGRGITVCERWDRDFAAFYADMGPRPAGLTLDRADNDGNYEPGNCSWASPVQQGNNQRGNRYVEHDGLRLTVAQWARRTGLKPATIRDRVGAYGWDAERAVSTPVDPTAGRFKPKAGVGNG